MMDGKEFFADNIISSAGVHVTYNQLLKNNVSATKNKIKALKPSVPHLCLYIGFKHTPEELNLSKTNLWLYPNNYDHDQNIKNYLADPEHAEFPVVYISFPAAKDPDIKLVPAK